MIFREKTLKNKKMVIVKNIKKHEVRFRYANRFSEFSCFTGFVLNPKDNKKYEIKTEIYYVGLYCKEPEIFFAYVDENDYSKYYIDLKQTNEYMYKQNFNYIKDIFKKYDAFSKETSVSKEIIEKECELDLGYMLRKKIVISENDKYYYSLNREKEIIELNTDKFKKKQLKDLKAFILILLISLTIAFLILCFMCK